jgi:uncharacterized protein with LGFP repeats
MGWPVLNQVTIPENGGGIAQLFTSGSLYSSPAGTYLVSGIIRDGYFSQNGAAGRLGWPISDQQCGLPRSGCVQDFAGGAVYAAPGYGARALWGSMLSAFRASGGPGGPWGQPFTDQNYLDVNGGGYGMAFTAGSAYSARDGLTYFVSGAIRDFYFQHAGAAGEFGFPIGPQTCSPERCLQPFQFGWIIWSLKDGARAGSPDIDAAYAAAGGPAGVLGARTNPLVFYPFNGGGLAEGFVGGPIYWKAGVGAHAVIGATMIAYFAQGGAAGRFGWPTGDTTCADGAGCSQPFERATIFSSGGTAFGVEPPVLAAYIAAGGSAGDWGAPLTPYNSIPQNGGGRGQAFDHGSVYVAGDGVPHYTTGQIRDLYFRYAGAAGPLGFPTADQVCGLSDGGCFQAFQGGTVFWSPASGAHVSNGPILTVYVSEGGPNGAYGWPITGVNRIPENGGGWGQAFYRGSAYLAEGSSTAYFVSGAIRDQYFTVMGAAGPMGFPTGAQQCTADGSSCVQSFQGGVIRWSRAAGASIG